MKALLALAAALALGACDDIRFPLPGMTRVSGDSPYPPDCNGAPQNGEVLRGAEVEPFLAIDPADPDHRIGTWQQDRWTNGGSNGEGVAATLDGGATWTRHDPAFSRCSGGDYERASDPWVAIGDGGAYVVAIAFDTSLGARSAVLAARSTDGGVTWDAPVTLIVDDDPDIFSDKESVFADADHAYVAWDRLVGVSHPTDPTGTGPTYLARSTDGAWDTARSIYDPGVDAQTIGNVLAETAGAAPVLVDAFAELTAASSDDPHVAIGAIASSDQGDTWSPRVVIADGIESVGVRDPSGIPVRDGEGLPSLGAGPDRFYVAWQDASVAGDHDGIVFSSSADGATWTVPAPVNDDLGFAAFSPQVAVTPDGTVGVTYYTFDGEDAQLWLATSTDEGATWSSESLTGPFDLTLARVGNNYFLGDYQGLAAADEDFVPFFAAPDRGGRGETDIFTPAPP